MPTSRICSSMLAMEISDGLYARTTTVTDTLVRRDGALVSSGRKDSGAANGL